MKKSENLQQKATCTPVKSQVSCPLENDATSQKQDYLRRAAHLEDYINGMLDINEDFPVRIYVRLRKLGSDDYHFEMMVGDANEDKATVYANGMFLPLEPYSWSMGPDIAKDLAKALMLKLRPLPQQQTP